MRSEELQNLWFEWLDQSVVVLQTLHEETAALMLKDTERVKRVQPVLQQLLNDLTDIDEQALAAAKRLADSLAIHPDIETLTIALGKEEAQELLGLSNRVKAEARTIEGVIKKNRRLFREELLPSLRADSVGRAAVLMG